MHNNFPDFRTGTRGETLTSGQCLSRWLCVREDQVKGREIRDEIVEVNAFHREICRNILLLFKVFIQHCFICRPQIPPWRQMLWCVIEPRTVAKYALAVRRSNYSHPHSARFHEIQPRNILEIYHLCASAGLSQILILICTTWGRDTSFREQSIRRRSV